MCFQLNPTRMAEWASRIRVTTQEVAAMQALPIAEPFVIIYIYIFFFIWRLCFLAARHTPESRNISQIILRSLKNSV